MSTPFTVKAMVPPQFGLQLPPGPVQSRDLQRVYPTLYARPVHPLPLAHVVPNAFRSFETLKQVTRHKGASDDDLANLDDNSKRVGSLLIATLATLGLKQRVFGVGEFLGFASWFGAMGLTPRIINAMVKLKAGVDLNQQYDSTYGTRQKIFRDPNYLPLQLLTDTQINRAADKLGIPKNAPNRRQLTEEKMRQVSVQAHTWWMLVAGPATPVISGLICDRLQDPLTRMLNSIKLAAARHAAEQNRRNPEGLAHQTQKVLDQMIGEVPESTLSSWWKQFGRSISKSSGLQDALSVNDATRTPREQLTETLANRLSRLAPQSPQVNQTLHNLRTQRGVIAALQKQANDFLKQHEAQLPPAVLERQQRLVETRILNAQSTLTHYENLFKTIRQGGTSPQQIRALMEKPVLAEVQRLIDTGYVTEAKKLVGNEDVFRQIRKSLDIRQFGRAFKLMGASPQAHMITALKDSMLRKLWQRRIIGYLGGGMLAATAFYNLFFIGKDFQKKGGWT